MICNIAVTLLGTGEDTPVIANVISLAGTPPVKSSASERAAQQSKQKHINKYYHVLL